MCIDVPGSSLILAQTQACSVFRNGVACRFRSGDAGRAVVCNYQFLHFFVGIPCGCCTLHAFRCSSATICETAPYPPAKKVNSALQAFFQPHFVGVLPKRRLQQTNFLSDFVRSAAAGSALLRGGDGGPSFAGGGSWASSCGRCYVMRVMLCATYCLGERRRCLRCLVSLLVTRHQALSCGGVLL
jgi:hypothetical protein